MRYTYTSAWSLRGGFSLPDGVLQRVLYSTDDESFTLTRDPTGLLSSTDRTQAIGRALLQALSGDPIEDVDAFVEAEVAEIVAKRNQDIGGDAVLMHVVSGDVDVDLEGKSQTEVGGQLVVLDAVDKRRIARAQACHLQAMQLSLALESQNPIKFRLLTSGVYLAREDLISIHSISFYAVGEASVISELSADAEAGIASGYARLRGLPGLESVQRLFSQMSDGDNDRLKSFLAGWAALEILVAKTFSQLEDRFFAPLAQGGQISLRERFLTRVKAVMGDKYRLTDKFIAIAAVLLPDAREEELDHDCQEFCEIKRLRDSIYHGEEFQEKDLPVDQLARLLLKYMSAYLGDTNGV